MGKAPKLSDYFTFTFVRNPWDRTVSIYFYLERKRKEPKAPQDMREGMQGITSFKEFVDHLMARPVWLRKRHACRSQADFLKDRDGKAIVDFVGKFENLADDFSRVCALMDVQASLPHVNTSDHAEYAEYYDADLIDKVGSFYEADVNHFGYESP